MLDGFEIVTSGFVLSTLRINVIDLEVSALSVTEIVK